MHEKRFYRDWVKESNLKTFEVKLFETDLLISAAKDLKKEAEGIVYKYRKDLLDYIDKNRQFKESFTPIAMDEGLRFAIREGGHTVGAGVVSKIVE